MQNLNQIGYCMCPKCGFSMPAPKGTDCSNVKCPKCGNAMFNGSSENDIMME